ncbi:hypothetical protein BD560DRAFT_412040 [Blakeslea trispora]|nr:hypothetical protein BD560DRAFT_412040 [Blakeslea trispora]
MIHLLPAEIVDRISTFLERGDLYQLTNTNYALHNLCVIYLYKKIDCCSLKGLEDFLRITRHFGLVKSLSISTGFDRQCQLPDLPTYLPFLTSLTLNVYSKLTLSNLSTFQHLNALTIEIWVDDAPFLPHLLSVTSYLTYLNVRQVYNSLDWLSNLHQLCPHLEHVGIVIDRIESLAVTDFVPDRPFEKLKSFNLKSIFDLPQHQRWLQFIANRFPNIECLKLESGMPERTERTPYPAKFYDWFFLSCPYLMQFEWFNIVPDDPFLSRLNDKQRQAQELSLMSLEATKVLLFPFKASSSIYLSTLINLEIQIPISMSCDTFIQSLAAVCSQLRQLKLSSLLNFTANVLSIHTLLDLFQDLNTLQLNGFELYVNHDKQQEQQKRQATISHPLKKISLRNGGVSCSLFDSIGRRCPDIQCIVLDQVVQTEKDRMKIHLPCHTLIEVDITDVRFVSGHAQLQSLQIQQKERTDWYFRQKEEAFTIWKHLSTTTSKELNYPRKQTANLHLSPIYPFLLDSDATESCDSLNTTNGCLSLVCQSIQSLYINDKKLR